jgi:hypothetical protein
MKIFWVSCDLVPKCFFRSTREEAQGECDFRINNTEGDFPTDPRYGNWFVEEEDVPDSEFRNCWNDHEPRLPYQPDCCVGMVRKSRSGLRKGTTDEGTCNSCPYFDVPDGEDWWR